jgi:hypothetical protein
MHAIRGALEANGSSIHVGDPIHLPGKVRDRRAGKDLPGTGDAAQPSREIERATPVPAVDGDSLTRIQPDPDGERKRWLRHGLVHEPALELDRRPDRLPGRVEDREGFVTAELDDHSAPGLDALACHHSEPRGKCRRRLVAALLSEEGVSADVGDQERPDMDVV